MNIRNNFGIPGEATAAHARLERVTDRLLDLYGDLNRDYLYAKGKAAEVRQTTQVADDARLKASGFDVWEGMQGARMQDLRHVLVDMLGVDEIRLDQAKAERTAVAR